MDSALTPEISEFSYGFALTNEMVGWVPLRAAPIFPSLIAEGQAGGGYDLNLDSPGIPIFLQFKRSECMTRKSAKEIAKFGAPLSIPYHRFHVTEAGKSNQHQMLCDLDNGTNFVAYAAPRFHRLAEINRAWGNGQVVSSSIFVRPSLIGHLAAGTHSVAFDDVSAFVCSEPRDISVVRGGAILGELETALDAEDRPVSEAVADWLGSIHDVVARDRLVPWPTESDETTQLEETAKVRRVHVSPTEEFARIEDAAGPSVSPIATRSPKTLSGPAETLRHAADSALETLNTQLIVVQKT